MDTQTVERVRPGTVAGQGNLVAYAGAAAFIVAAAWFYLVAKGVTISAAPSARAGEPAQQAMRAFYRWQAGIYTQERYYTSIAIAGFLALAAAAASLRNRPGLQRVPARLGALLTSAGAGVWTCGNVLVLGGHHAVAQMATHTNPIGVTNSIAFTIDTIDNAFALAAFTLIGAGLLSFAAAAHQSRSAGRAWPGYTLVVALVTLVTAVSYAAGKPSFSDLMLLISGVVVLPVWLVWAGRTSVPGPQPQP